MATKLLSFFSIIAVVRALDLFNTSLERRINSCAMLPNISDKELLIQGPLDFIYDNGVRRTELISRRVRPIYKPPSDDELKSKTLDMMKQAIYNTQVLIKQQESVFSKYQNGHSFRMSFMYNRLRQMIIDIRRIYTVALKKRFVKRVWDEIYWYTHAAKKFIEILYLVQYVIDTTTKYKIEEKLREQNETLRKLEDELKSKNKEDNLPPPPEARGAEKAPS